MWRMYSSFSHTFFPLPRLCMCYIPFWKLSPSRSCLYEKQQHGLELRMCPFLSENQHFPSVGSLSVNHVCWAFHAPFPPTEEQQRTCSSRRNQRLLIISACFCSFASPPTFPWRSTPQWEALFSSWSWRRQYAQSLSFSSFLFPPLTLCNVMNGDSLR